MRENRYGHASEEEKRDGEKFCQRARLTLDKLRSGRDEASRQLRNEDAEQAEISAAVDVPCDDA
jgi:hypothetical protein